MPEITFQIMSNLHLETPQSRTTYADIDSKPCASHLALLGNTGNVCEERLFPFLETQRRQFQIVLFLLGNHEPYGTSFPAARAIMRSFENKMKALRKTSDAGVGEFIFLHQTRYDVSSHYTILGCTLFSEVLREQVMPVQLFVSDFTNIDNWTVDNRCEAHTSDLSWLNLQVSSLMRQEPSRWITIFTHHSPPIIAAAVDLEKEGDANQVRSAFSTDLSKELCWTCPQVKLWAYGHTHFNCDFEDPRTRKRVYANQKWYRRAEVVDFDAMKVIEFSRNGQISTRAAHGHIPVHDLGLSRKQKSMTSSRDRNVSSYNHFSHVLSVL
jgi:hypothetical protein